MATEHHLLRSAMDNADETKRLLDRYNRRDLNFQFTTDDLHTIRGAATIAMQSARALSELSGYLEAIIREKKKL
jgi:hypothetical protein